MYWLYPVKEGPEMATIPCISCFVGVSKNIEDTAPLAAAARRSPKYLSSLKGRYLSVYIYTFLIPLQIICVQVYDARVSL